MSTPTRTATIPESERLKRPAPHPIGTSTQEPHACLTGPVRDDYVVAIAVFESQSPARCGRLSPSASWRLVNDEDRSGARVVRYGAVGLCEPVAVDAHRRHLRQLAGTVRHP